MTNLEKLEGLKNELNRLDSIFNNLSVKDEKVLDSIIEQIRLVEEEMNLLMKKSKVEERLNRSEAEEVENVGKLREFYNSLLNRIKVRKNKNDITKSIFETEYEPETVVEKIHKEHEEEKKISKVRSNPIFINGEIIE